MAGIIVADTIQSGGSFIRLNSASQTVATINASGIYANTGNLLIAANGTIGVASITNTAITGTITQAQIGNGVATTGPFFYVTMSANQTVSSGVWTKVQFNTESYDTASCYDSATNYRFTPNIAGHYQFNYHGQFSLGGGGNITRFIGDIAKNGSYGSARVFDVNGVSYSQSNQLSGSQVHYMNGTTDYVEIWAYVTSASGSPRLDNSDGVHFSGYLVRAA